MKLSAESKRKDGRPQKSVEVLMEKKEAAGPEFDPRRDIPKKLWEEVEDKAQHATITDLKSNVSSFLRRLLALSVIDEKLKTLLLSRDDLIQHELNRLPIVTDPEKHGVTRGYLEQTASLLQVKPDLGPLSRAHEKPAPDGYKWYIDQQLDGFSDFFHLSKQTPPAEEEDWKRYLAGALEGSLSVIRLFPTDRTALLTELKEQHIPEELLKEAKNELQTGDVEFGLEILAYVRILFPEKSDECQMMMKPFWNGLKDKLRNETWPYRWPSTAFSATLLAAHEVWVDQEGKIQVRLHAPAATTHQELPERYVA